jgi:hypothetical protein
VTHAGRKRGKDGGIEHLAWISRQHDRLSPPRLVDDRRDARTGHVGRRVHVRDEPDDRVARAGQRREDGVPPVELRIGQPDLTQLIDEQAREVQLLRRARTLLDAVRRLRVDADVSQEALEDVARELLGQRGRERGARRQALRTG